MNKLERTTSLDEFRTRQEEEEIDSMTLMNRWFLKSDKNCKEQAATIYNEFVTKRSLLKLLDRFECFTKDVMLPERSDARRGIELRCCSFRSS
jgi:hypothetical protein